MWVQNLALKSSDKIVDVFIFFDVSVLYKEYVVQGAIDSIFTNLMPILSFVTCTKLHAIRPSYRRSYFLP